MIKSIDGVSATDGSTPASPLTNSEKRATKVREWHRSTIHGVERFPVDRWRNYYAANPPEQLKSDELRRWNLAVDRLTRDTPEISSLYSWLAANTYVVLTDQSRIWCGLDVMVRVFAYYDELSDWDIVGDTARKDQVKAVVGACETLAKVLDGMPAARIPNFETTLVRSRLESQPRSMLIKQCRTQMKVARDLVDYRERFGRGTGPYKPSFVADARQRLTDQLNAPHSRKPRFAVPNEYLVDSLMQRRSDLAWNIEGLPSPDSMVRAVLRINPAESGDPSPKNSRRRSAHSREQFNNGLLLMTASCTDLTGKQTSGQQSARIRT